ncbi:MAG: lipoyl synthase [Candidatus Wallbacteria bacterium]|nr:lipoyl synthase [Candidatus Wallbacteria bacterium]
MQATRKPEWFKVPPPWGREFARVDRLMKREALNTVCKSALCPNIGECFNRGTATFLLLGDRCTRNCPYCNIDFGKPAALPDPDEPRRVAEAVRALDLRHAVLTGVARDDLPDGGSAHFARAVRAVRESSPGTTVEVLIPDFRGVRASLETVLAARPEVLNHNVETVARLYRPIRPSGDYERSMTLLARAREIAPDLVRKSGMMVGLGETTDEVLRTLEDLSKAACQVVTIGQYLRPPGGPVPVDRYYRPEEFDQLKRSALAMGFEHVEAGPLVRSSYHAADQVIRKGPSGPAA